MCCIHHLPQLLYLLWKGGKRGICTGEAKGLIRKGGKEGGQREEWLNADEMHRIDSE